MASMTQIDDHGVFTSSKQSILVAMSIYRMLLVAVSTTCLLAVSPPVLATTVYKSTSPEGVVSFSDTPPDNDDAVELVEVTPTPPGSADEYRENIAAMRETTDRLAEDRRKREKHRAEMRELAARKHQQPSYENDYYPSGYISSYSSYRRRYGYGILPWHPGYRPTPEHPIVRPPVTTTPHVNLGGNSQLMRPLVSQRR